MKSSGSAHPGRAARCVSSISTAGAGTSTPHEPRYHPSDIHGAITRAEPSDTSTTLAMKLSVVRAVLVTTALTVLAACSDNKDVGADLLDDVDEGTPKDTVLALIGTGPLTGVYADTARIEKGFRRNRYLVDGKLYEVLFYRELQGNVAEPVQQAKETPIVIKDGKVVGWGWRFYVEAMESLKLPSPLAPVSAPSITPAPAPAGESTKPDTSSKA